MNSYFSLAFLCVFLPLVIVAYAAVPRRVRWGVLLVASYVFFWSLSGILLAFALVATVTTYVAGRVLAAQIASRDATAANAPSDRRTIRSRYAKRMRLIVALAIAIDFGMLAAMKYLTFFGGIAQSLISLVGIDVSLALPSWAAPIGISFYTLMAVSYLVDVYRETIPAERHLGRVALYLAFFPQIMEGPIARYGETGQRLCAGNPLTWDNFNAGMLRILWGLAKKIIVADRLNAFVKPVFDNYGSYDGGMIAAAAILYTIQLYCDFSGTIDVGIGIGRLFGVTLPENFRQPFFSRTSSEFWQRWHITLGTWFRDYVYYPVSLSSPIKKLTKRARRRLGNHVGPLATSAIALFCVWFGNGLWHGAGSQYMFFGMYYFVIIVAGSFLEAFMRKVCANRGINREALGWQAFQIARTLVIVFVGEMFFRAQGLNAGLEMFGKLIGSFTLESFANGTFFSTGLDALDCVVVGIVCLLMLGVGIAKERGVDVSGVIRERGALRWSVPLVLFTAILVFGAYGTGYIPVDPIYSQF